MTDIAKDIANHLLSQDEIRALVQNRVYPDVLPQRATIPAIVITGISRVPHVGTNTAASADATTRLQIDCFAISRAQANQVAEAVRVNNMQANRGLIGETWVDAIHCDESARYDIDQPTDGSNAVRYVTSQDYMIFHATSTS